MLPEKRKDIFASLQSDILRLQGFRPVSGQTQELGLGPVLKAFPHSTFPVGAMHEFLSETNEDAAATGGFIASLLSGISGTNGCVLWVSASRNIFPPALKSFGLQPDRCIFVDAKKEKDVLWIMDEALKCSALSAVVGEVNDISFIASRRLQLAVEQSSVTGFIIRRKVQNIETTACVSRWRITSLPSEPIDDLPGVGFPQWKLELLRVKNGKPGIWNVISMEGKIIHPTVPEQDVVRYMVG